MKKICFLFIVLLSYTGFSQESKAIENANPPETLKSSFELKTSEAKSEKNFVDNKILYVQDGKSISEAEVNLINPSAIESMNVIKDKKEIAKYTQGDFDGVIIIKMK